MNDVPSVKHINGQGQGTACLGGSFCLGSITLLHLVSNYSPFKNIYVISRPNFHLGHAMAYLWLILLSSKILSNFAYMP